MPALVLFFAASMAAVLAHAAQPKVLVLGDSLSAGYGLASGQGWVDLLQKKIVANGLPHKVVNASISGDTTSGGRARIGAALEAQKPDIVVVELGGNDGLRGNSLKDMRANLEAIVTAAEKAGARVLLLGMQLPPNYGKRYIGEFAAVFSDLARSRNLPFVPFFLSAFGGNMDMFQPDHIHPAAKAQPLMVDAVWPALSPLLAMPATASR